MTAYTLRRLGWIGVMLILVTLLSFVIFHLLPSADPAVLRAGPEASPRVLAEVREDLGLDRPLPEQYGAFVTRMALHGDLGASLRSGEPVVDQIARALPVTLSLAAGAALLWLVLGVTLGALAAVRHRRRSDRLIVAGALVAFLAPGYVVGTGLLYLFAEDVGRLPLAGGAGAYVAPAEDPLAWARALALPWIALALPLVGLYTRLVRSSLLETLDRDYVTLARAKGLRERDVVLRHALRAALTPVVTLLALDAAALLSGIALVEIVFNVPGLGRLALEAAQAGDLPVIEATVLVSALLILLANLLADLSYAVLDPRVRLTTRG